MVDDEDLIGEIARKPVNLFGLIGIDHQLEQLVVTSKKRDAVSKLRLVGDAWPRGEAFRPVRSDASSASGGRQRNAPPRRGGRALRPRRESRGWRSRCSGQRRPTTCRASRAIGFRRADRRRGPRRLPHALRRPLSDWPRRADSRTQDNSGGWERDRRGPKSRPLWGGARGAGPCQDPTDGQCASMIGPRYSPATLRAPMVRCGLRRRCDCVGALVLLHTVSRVELSMQQFSGAELRARRSRLRGPATRQQTSNSLTYRGGPVTFL